jgi:fatty acid desaturase
VRVGVRGKWYDVSNFVERHPGGDVLLEFQDRDATAQFIAFHDEAKVLKHWKPVGTYEFDEAAPGGDPLEGEYLKLAAHFEREGYFETDMRWFARRLALIAMMLLGALLGAIAYVQAGSRLSFVAGAVLLGGFWQQSFGLQHEFGHNQIFHRRRLDLWGEWFFGSVCYGYSGFRDDHNEHHIFTRTVIAGVGPSDPEIAGVTDPKLFEFIERPALRRILKIQHIIFFPVLIFVWPFVVKIAPSRSQNRPSDFAALGIHWLWVAMLVSVFPSWVEGGLFYFVASCSTGVFMWVLLTLSHTVSPLIEKDQAKYTGTWMRRQLVCIDVASSCWMDWLHCGFDLHSVHHLFPRMPIHNYRKAHAHITAAAAKHDVKVHKLSWSGAIVQQLRHLRKMKTLLPMEPTREQGSPKTGM